jgi:hypothetical protein
VFDGVDTFDKLTEDEWLKIRKDRKQNFIKSCQKTCAVLKGQEKQRSRAYHASGPCGRARSCASGGA